MALADPDGRLGRGAGRADRPTTSAASAPRPSSSRASPGPATAPGRGGDRRRAPDALALPRGGNRSAAGYRCPGAALRTRLEALVETSGTRGSARRRAKGRMGTATAASSHTMICAGIDAGSRTTKVVLLDAASRAGAWPPASSIKASSRMRWPSRCWNGCCRNAASAAATCGGSWPPATAAS